MAREASLSTVLIAALLILGVAFAGKKVTHLRKVAFAKGLQPTSDQLLCTTSTDCIETSAGDCSGCACAVAINRTHLPDFLVTARDRCKDFSGELCPDHCPVAQVARCNSGRCEMLTGSSAAECSRAPAGSDTPADPVDVARCRMRVAESTMELNDCPERANTGDAAPIFAACVTMIAKSQNRADTCDQLNGVFRATCIGILLARTPPEPSPIGCDRFKLVEAEIDACSRALLDEVDASKITINETACARLARPSHQMRCRSLKTFRGTPAVSPPSALGASPTPSVSASSPPASATPPPSPGATAPAAPAAPIASPAASASPTASAASAAPDPDALPEMTFPGVKKK